MDRERNRRVIGFVMVLTAAVFWGLSGSVAQRLFDVDGFEPGWLVTVRLLVSGLLLLAMQMRKTNIFLIWKQQAIPLILFGILGMLAVQYTYFAAIASGNAATATLLQYLGPVLILLYGCLRFRKMPKAREWSAVLLALMGTYLLLTNGLPQNLAISPAAVWWGLASAGALAYYTLYPGKLLKEWGSGLVVGWGMLIGGVGMTFVSPPWTTSGQHWTLLTAGFVVFVIVFGTLLAFYLYLKSLDYIEPMETSLLACAEPLSASITAVIWLGVSFGSLQMLGGTLIVATVVLLSIRVNKKEGDKREHCVS